MKEKVIKLVVSFLLVGSYFFLPKYGFTAFDGSLTSHPSPLIPHSSFLVSHFLYPLSHASIFHLSANILCLWMLRCPTHIFATYIIAILCSFLPSVSLYDILAQSIFRVQGGSTAVIISVQGGSHALAEPTMGFSGILFAMVGISWGRIHRFRDMILRNKWYLIIPAFLPHVNFLIHIYCLLLGYLYGSHILSSIKFLSSIKQADSRHTNKPCDKKSANS